MNYLILGRDYNLDTKAWQRTVVKDSVNPEHAVKRAGMAGYDVLEVYPLQMDEDGKLQNWTREQLDL